MLQSKALAAEDMRSLIFALIFSNFTNFRTFGIAIDDPELLRGRTVAQNIALLALSNCESEAAVLAACTVGCPLCAADPSSARRGPCSRSAFSEARTLLSGF